MEKLNKSKSLTGCEAIDKLITAEGLLTEAIDDLPKHLKDGSEKMKNYTPIKSPINKPTNQDIVAFCEDAEYMLAQCVNADELKDKSSEIDPYILNAKQAISYVRNAMLAIRYPHLR